MSYRENVEHRMLGSHWNSKVGNSYDGCLVKKRYSDYLEDALKTEMGSESEGDYSFQINSVCKFNCRSLYELFCSDAESSSSSSMWDLT